MELSLRFSGIIPIQIASKRKRKKNYQKDEKRSNKNGKIKCPTQLNEKNIIDRKNEKNKKRKN